MRRIKKRGAGIRVVPRYEAPVEQIAEPIEVEEKVVAEEVVEEVVETVEAPIVEEAVEVAEESVAEEVVEDVEPEVDEIAENSIDEVPLETSADEEAEILEEEGSLDGDADEVALASQISDEESVAEDIVETVEEPVAEEVVEAVEEPVAEEVVETVEEPIVEEIVEAVEEPVAEEVVEAVEEPVVEEVVEADESDKEIAADAVAEVVEGEAEAPSEEVVPVEKETFKLTPPANLADIMSVICAKRGRKLIYRPNEILFNVTAAVNGTDKNNEEGIKIKNILDEEIKQGVKLGYIEKYDGLKMSEIKEEYENDVVYEYAEQEFKRAGLVLDGDVVKVYVYDWDMKAVHHVGYVDAESAALLKPYLVDREKYSFDVCGLITGGKYRKVVKDGDKVTVEKGTDGKLGIELDVSIVARKD